MIEAIKRFFGRRPTTFEAFRGSSGKWFVRELAGNGETVNVSEAYQSKGNAVRSAKRQAAQATNGKWKVVP